MNGACPLLTARENPHSTCALGTKVQLLSAIAWASLTPRLVYGHADCHFVRCSDGQQRQAEYPGHVRYDLYHSASRHSSAMLDCPAYVLQQGGRRRTQSSLELRGRRRQTRDARNTDGCGGEGAGRHDFRFTKLHCEYPPAQIRAAGPVFGRHFHGRTAGRQHLFAREATALEGGTTTAILAWRFRLSPTKKTISSCFRTALPAAGW